MNEKLRIKEKYIFDNKAKAKVAFQGLKGAYSHLATKNIFKNCETVPCTNFENAFDSVKNNVVDYAVIPIENSLGGRVADIHYLLPKFSLNIIGEYYLPIKHCLLGIKDSKFENIKDVYSHEQALRQCYLNLKNMNMNPIKFIDTAGAAEYISNQGDNKNAAIASKIAAKIYNLDILKEDMEDKPYNLTRFIILAKNNIVFEENIENNKCITSCIFRVKSLPSILYKCLGGFATSGINMVKLESYVPMRDLFSNKKNKTAEFYIEFEGNPNDKLVKIALDELSFFTHEINILGTYFKNSL